MSTQRNEVPVAVAGRWQRTAEFAGLTAPDGSLASTIFAEMSALAQQTGAINLGQGFPDEDGPAVVLQAAKDAIDAGINQYPPGRGIPDLRAAVAEHERRFYDIELDPATEVLITAGATEGISATLLALLEPGDEVITFEPFYDEYGAVIGLAGGEHVVVPLRAPDFLPDFDELAAAFTSRTRAILVNNPLNPTGTVFPRAYLERIVALATEHDTLIITDEVYEHLTFGVTHTPIASLPGAWSRTVTISSAAKTFSVTGWKIGWVTAPAELITAILTVKQYLTFVNGAPFQPAVATGLRLDDDFYRGLGTSLERKRDILVAGLREAGLTVFEPRGTYFVVADAAPLGFADAAVLCRDLPRLGGVVGVPITAFVTREHADDYRSLVRFAFCKRESVLRQAAQQLAAISAL